MKLIRLLRVALIWTCFSFLQNAAFSEVELWEFTGDFCQACRQMQPVVDQLRRDGVPFRAIDVRTQPELVRRFQIANIPCFLAMVDGAAVERVEGAVSIDRLRALLNSVRKPGFAQPTVRGQAPVASEVPWDTRGAAVAEPATAIPLQAPIAYLRSEAALSHCSSAEPPVDARLDVEPSTKVPSESSSISPSEQQALEATVRLKIVDEQGHSYGTGTIIDVHEDEALVLTCGHIFRDSRGKGDIICDLFVNGDATGIPGKLIGYNLRRDVGLVSIRPGIRVSPVQVGGSGRQPKDGDAVFAVGCDHGKDPTILRNSIRAVNRYHGPANLVVGGRPVDGRSGGGLFTREGILIGVCNAADQEANEGLYAALGPIHAELDQAGLGFIYRNEEAAVAAAPDKQSSIRPRVEAIASRVLPPRRLLPSPMTSSGRSETSADPTAEVIVITRDPQNPNQPGQVYVLDRPSQGLLQTLANELSRRGPHVATAGRGQTSTSLNSFELPSGPEGGNWHSGP